MLGMGAFKCEGKEESDDGEGRGPRGLALGLYSIPNHIRLGLKISNINIYYLISNKYKCV